MRKSLTGFIVGAIVIQALIIQAQQTPPWPPDPAMIFADGVQWSAYEEVVLHGEIRLDNFNRIVRIFDGETGVWRDYPYPVESVSFEEAVLQSDGLIRLYFYRYDEQFEPLPSNVLMLDPTKGLYTAPRTVCADQVVQAAAGEGRWTAPYHSEADQKILLCHSGTGEQRDILPSNLIEWRSFPTPNAQNVVLIGGQGADLVVYTYHPDEDRLINLGVIPPTIMEALISICDWASDTRGLICISDRWRSAPPDYFYAFDLSQSVSLEPAFVGWEGSIFRLETPHRYGAVFSQAYVALSSGSTDGAPIPCTIIIFTAEGLRTEELGYECIPMNNTDFYRSPYYPAEDSLYVLTIEDRQATVTSLYRYDLLTLTRSEALFTGEVESVLGASPDGRYVVLLVDDNGELDFNSISLSCCTSLRHVAIFDTSTSNFVYMSEPLAVLYPGQVIWLDAQTVVIAAQNARIRIPTDETGGGVQGGISGSLRRISLNAASGRTLDLVNVEAFIAGASVPYTSPNKRYVLLPDERTVFDLTNFTALVLLRPDVPAEYIITTAWLPNSDLRVTVSDGASGQYATYRVDLPE